MNIIKRELRSNLKALIIWVTSLSLIILVASTEFSAYHDNPDLIAAFEGFEDMFAALGGSIANIGTPEGFLSLMSIYLYLPASIYGALLGSSIISKEEKDRTAEYLFTLPVTRNQVLRSKIIAAVFYQIVFVTIIILASILIFYRYNLDENFYSFMRHMFLALTMISLIFMSIGMLLASYLEQYKKSGSLTLGLLIGTYMLNMLIGVVEELEFLKYIVPFQYFTADNMINSNIEFIFVFLSLLIISSCISGVFIFYKKRDLYI